MYFKKKPQYCYITSNNPPTMGQLFVSEDDDIGRRTRDFDSLYRDDKALIATDDPEFLEWGTRLPTEEEKKTNFQYS